MIRAVSLTSHCTASRLRELFGKEKGFPKKDGQFFFRKGELSNSEDDEEYEEDTYWDRDGYYYGDSEYEDDYEYQRPAGRSSQPPANGSGYGPNEKEYRRWEQKELKKAGRAARAAEVSTNESIWIFNRGVFAPSVLSWGRV